MSSRSLLLALSRALAAALVSGAATAPHAEFHRWVDDHGRRHVSNIPRAGVRADGRLTSAHDPNSAVYQHAAMLTRLRRDAAAIERERKRQLAAEHAGELRAAAAARWPVPRAAPKEGSMSLDELISLEKRGGRWLGPETAP